MTASSDGMQLRLERTLEAPPDAVFRAWTEPEAMKRWLAPGELVVALAEVDLRVGGRFRLHMRQPDGVEHRASGTYREVAPPDRLVFTWQWESGPEPEETLVTVELKGQGPRTRMTLIHEGLADAQSVERHTAGWTGCLAKLEEEYAAAAGESRG